MSDMSRAFGSAVRDFRAARFQAALQSILSRVTGRPDELLSYEDVVKKLRPTGRSERGVREIPLEAIVGSVGRATDFTRSFLPLRDSDEQRWARVKAFADEHGLDALPPIDVYQIGEAYFVHDGNHRVSVARLKGRIYIDASVTEVQTRVPLAPGAKPDELIIKAEYAAFLEYTRIDQLRPGCDLSVSVPGQYPRLEDHIEAHRYRMEERQGEVSLREAACAWYDEVFLPVAQAIREHGILRYFPGCTETDLFLWLSDHRVALQRELGWQVEPHVAAERLAAQIKHQPELASGDVRRLRRETGRWRREKLVDRYGDRLFADILVPIRGKERGWRALDQALALARAENANIYGLHVTESEARGTDGEVDATRMEFQRRCKAAGIAGQIGVEAGDVANQVCERAVMTDLVIVELEHPPAHTAIARLGSKFTTILRRAVRPVMAVPGAASPLTHALLAYDGSGKAREALFVAAYFAERFKMPLIILSVEDVAPDALDYASRYLDMHEAQADFVQSGGPVAEAILRTATDRSADLLLMGGYGATPVRQMVLGGSVEQVLRESSWPVLVCL